ncbi:hypothetical protein Z4250 [Escherichia coli O157:H7 str. EDL933]|uniref:Uncharacterized protein n=1 Tax=Escherichia coli O157:H7 TaxID=83334 RepID=Q8X4H8_ECO57|nr:hypothetical protein Z4250 [Escherichia coli O157:H7 str. EDL933]ACT73622.1 predicted protein [Escherichia coli O157:H7 str. TW14359]CAK5458206.1 Cysteine hydrolase [Escherichia coli]
MKWLSKSSVQGDAPRIALIDIVDSLT